MIGGADVSQPPIARVELGGGPNTFAVVGCWLPTIRDDVEDEWVVVGVEDKVVEIDALARCVVVVDERGVIDLVDW